MKLHNIRSRNTISIHGKPEWSLVDREVAHLYFHKWKVAETTVGSKGGAGVWDLAGVLDGTGVEYFIEIEDLWVDKDCRGQGYSKRLLQELFELFPANSNIFYVCAGAHSMEYSKEPTPEEYEEILSSMIKYYSRFGFKNANNDIGNYEFRRCLVKLPSKCTLSDKIFTPLNGEYKCECGVLSGKENYMQTCPKCLSKVIQR